MKSSIQSYSDSNILEKWIFPLVPVCACHCLHLWQFSTAIHRDHRGDKMPLFFWYQKCTARLVLMSDMRKYDPVLFMFSAALISRPQLQAWAADTMTWSGIAIKKALIGLSPPILWPHRMKGHHTWMMGMLFSLPHFSIHVPLLIAQNFFRLEKHFCSLFLFFDLFDRLEVDRKKWDTDCAAISSFLNLTGCYLWILKNYQG